MYINPDDFDRGYEFFVDCFEVWTVGYEKWGLQNFSATFVKDPAVPNGVIMYCPDGDIGYAQAINIVDIKKNLPRSD